MARHIVFAVTFLYFINTAYPQNEPLADSLKLVLTQHGVSDSLRSDILYELMQLSSDPAQAIAYADSLLQMESEGGNVNRVIRAYRVKGVAFRMKGDLKTALDYLFESAKRATESEKSELLAGSFLEIGSTYSSNSDLTNALLYQNKAIVLLRQLNKDQELAINLLNTGYTYYSLNQYDTALLYYNEAGPIFDSLGLTIGQAYNLGNRALVYWKTGRMKEGEQDLLKAIEMLTPLGDQYGMADYHNQLGHLYLDQGQKSLAVEHLQLGLKMALELDLKEQIRDASLLLSRLHASNEEYDKGYHYHQQYAAYKDSIQNRENTTKMADLRTEFEVNLKEMEIDALEKDKKLKETYILVAIILLMFSVVLLLYFRQRYLNTRLLASTERNEHDSKIKDLLRTQETKALQAMVQGKEEERKHLARELHNHLGSLLATVKVNLNGLEHTDASRYQRIAGLVDQACQDVRNISHELNMGVSENFGLVPALKELVAHLQVSNKIRVEFTASLSTIYIDSESEILIYRIVQELVSNVLKHAKATRLTISLTGFVEEGIINVLVQDNGKGFDANQTDKRSGGMGLDSLKEMVQKLDGDMGIDSSAKGGTTVTIDLPVTAPEITMEES